MQSTPNREDHQRYTKRVDRYQRLFDENRGGGVEARRQEYTTLVNHYYDLVTDFYEFGWGQSFHFAPRRRGETFAASLIRHEHFLARTLVLRPGMRVLDIGCGVGGPMREIAKASGATIIGVNNNAYQIEKGERYVRREGLSDLCSFVKADFMKLPFENASIDAIYAIESTCHAPDRVALFRELCRVLKPGSAMAGYEWCLTDRFDPEREDHREIRTKIEKGDGLPELAFAWEVDQALEAADFELIETRDLVDESDRRTPWYLPLTGRDLSLRSLPRTPIGRSFTNVATRLLERSGIAPKGTTDVSQFLNRAADALVEGGRSKIFTPMYFFHVRKSGGAAAS